MFSDFHNFITKYGNKEERDEWSALNNEQGPYKIHGRKKIFAEQYKRDIYIGKCYGSSLGAQYVTHYTPGDISRYGVYQIHNKPLQHGPLFLDFPDLENENDSLLFASRLLSSSKAPLQYCAVSRNPDIRTNILGNMHHDCLNDIVNGVFEHTNLQKSHPTQRIILKGLGTGVYEAVYVLRAIVERSAAERKPLPHITLKLHDVDKIANMKVKDINNKKPMQAIKQICKDIKKTLNDHYSIKDSKSGTIETEVVGHNSSNEASLINALENFSYVYSTQKQNLHGSVPQKYNILKHIKYSAYNSPDYTTVDNLEIQNSKQQQLNLKYPE